MATKAADKNDKVTEPPPGSEPSASGTVGIPDKGEGKGEKRLFQNGPGEKIWMTKQEATKAGKFWAD